MGNIQPNWLAPSGSWSGRVAKQQVCGADKGRATQLVASQPVQAVDCGRDCSSLGHAQLVARVLSVNCGSCELMLKQYQAHGLW